MGKKIFVPSRCDSQGSHDVDWEREYVNILPPHKRRTRSWLRPAAARVQLSLWVTHPTCWNGKSILRGNPDLIIKTDDSQTGCGAQCRKLPTGGQRSPKEAAMHINCLELLAATLAIQTFAKRKENVLIHLKMDSTSALTYINKMGGTVSPDLNRLTKELWSWCLTKNVTLRASNLPGIFKEKADEESRIMKDRSDWMLCPETFLSIQAQLGPLEIDLFTSRLTKQLPTYVSWRPDSEALETDAFSMNLTDWKPMPTRRGTWSPRSWAKSGNRKQTLFWFAPVWKNQAWYSLLLTLLTQEPLLIPQTEGLIQPTQPINCPSIQPQIDARRISGKVLCTGLGDSPELGFKIIACLMEGNVMIRQDVGLTVQKMGWLVYWTGHWSNIWRCHKRGKFPHRPLPPRMSAQIPVLIQIGNLLCTWACWWTTNWLTTNGVKTLERHVPWKTTVQHLHRGWEFWQFVEYILTME